MHPLLIAYIHTVAALFYFCMHIWISTIQRDFQLFSIILIFQSNESGKRKQHHNCWILHTVRYYNKVSQNVTQVTSS